METTEAPPYEPLTELPEEFARFRDRYSAIYTVVSPPRCCSTAFARVFWEHPTVRYYAHEPFEVTHFRGAGLAQVIEKLDQPLDLRGIERAPGSPGANALTIKEMPYQVGDNFPLLAELATQPLVFLLRDPRLSIASRMEKKMEVGDSPIFPLIETGWELVEEQVAFCRREGIDFMIVHASDFCDHPEEIFGQVFRRMGLEFSPEQLTWNSVRDLEIDNLEGQHSHLYWEVLGSDGVSPELEHVPVPESFPDEGGFREHIERALEICHRLCEAPERIRVSG